MIKDYDTQTVKIQWNSRGKKKYTELGYQFTKMGDYFDVKVKDLSPNSHKKIIVLCDYCGEELLTEYRDYTRRKNNNEDVTCHKCFRKKGANTCIQKYGADNPSRIKEFQDKRNSTFQDKFGGNPFANEEVKEKIKQHYQIKYGVDSGMQVEEIKNKVKETCLQKYGYTNPNKSQQVKNKIMATNFKKYGCKSTLQNAEIRKKGLQTMFKNGHGKCRSKNETFMYNTLCELYGENCCQDSYMLDGKILDVLLTLDNCKIDVEYDGQYWHQNKLQDINRDIRIHSHGIKILRVLANNKVPTKEQLMQAVDYLVNNQCSKTSIILDIK